MSISKMLQKLEDKGWQEECPSADHWTFTKKDRVCILNWDTGHFHFWKRRTK